MNSFIKDLVGDNGWLGQGKTEIRLLCGFGPPLILKGIQEFIPNGGPIHTFQWRQDQNMPKAVPSLPMGIPPSNPEDEEDEFSGLEHHLDQLIADEDDLIEYADRMLRLCDYSRSSRTLKVVLKWYQNWKDVEESVSSYMPSLKSLVKRSLGNLFLRCLGQQKSWCETPSR